jgi:hypothetical protein
MAEILLKVVLNIINQTNKLTNWVYTLQDKVEWT